MDKDEVVCACFNVTVGDFMEAIENGAKSFEDVQEVTNAGTGCGQCIESNRELVAKLIAK